MDYRCPVCRMNLGKRRLGQAIFARMEVDCPHCKSTLRLNLHRTEVILVLLNFGSIVVLAAFAYLFQSQGLVLTALGAAALGALALPLLEQTYLRTWPRYTSTV
jgi:hypothetical protein